ncbi:thermonuclease family protein [Ciceribacter sp. L1K23]|uniref:thermonuclease family protein n=1 Tax=Ciceribacter sp. L1K23 TaxID=2820276 RepID=UPI001B82A345|nr:thermonuclease family protein [Ciceribacter sp. L1K23]MBR0555888.1 thermonuclease family protein [Ciceribacter sp. L1K23]
MTARRDNRTWTGTGTPSSASISSGSFHSNTAPLLVFLGLLLVGAFFSQRPAPVQQTDTVSITASAQFTLCGGSRRVNCVVDGDTFWLNGEKIRIADIDTPELSPPRCETERQLGEAAKRELLAQLNAGGFQLTKVGARDTDRYGRKLRTVIRDGHSVGDVLIEKGLARRWDGARRGWCA